MTRVTDAEWRDFQSIPDQGYSHRAWVDHKIASALDALATEYAETTAGAGKAADEASLYWRGATDAVEHFVVSLRARADFIRNGHGD